MEPEVVSLRCRSKSDVMSGITLSHSDLYGKFSQAELEAHFVRFKQYDLDDTGFITPANLKAIFESLEMPEVTVAQCENMVDEVAILIGHENDHALSFRDYAYLMLYEAEKKVAAEVAEAQEEERISSRENENSLDLNLADDDDQPKLRMRGSSFAVLQSLAVSRIAKFEEVVAAAQAAEKGTSVEGLKARTFLGKLSHFKRIESGDAASLNQDSAHKQTIKAKLAAFEAANKADLVAFKTSWKNVRQGTWKQKTVIAGGLPPKKALSELP